MCIDTALVLVEGKFLFMWVEVGDLAVTAGDFLLFLFG